MIQAIFFDFNGVIIDDELIQMNAYEEVLAEYGITLTEEMYFAALGMDDRTFVRSMFERSKKPLSNEVQSSVLRRKTDLHRKMTEELPLFPGVVTFLKATSREFSLGLVSMANREEIGYILERANLGSLFSIMVTADDVIMWKRPVTKNEALRQLVTILWEKARIMSPVAIFDAVFEREKQGSTFLNQGVAFPHARIEGLPASRVAIGIPRRGISDAETDVPIECVFLILSPTGNPNEMIELLALISRAIRDRHLTKKFREAEGPSAIVKAIWN